MKKYYVLGVLALCMVASPVAAAEEASIEDMKAHIEALQDIVSELSYLQFQLFATPAPETDDEGRFSVFVNDTLRFDCEGKADTDGELCVRHVGDLGESYVDLDTIKGLNHRVSNNYDLTLLKLRTDEFGTESVPQYHYTLVRINHLTVK